MSFLQIHLDNRRRPTAEIYSTLRENQWSPETTLNNGGTPKRPIIRCHTENNMNTTVTASELSATDLDVTYERLQVQGTVSNFTPHQMIVKSSNLSWGKWMQSPVDTPSFGISRFASQGRDSSPSGTEGTATWQIGNALITINFSCPLRGSNTQSISCEPAGAFKVTCTGTGGDVNSCTFQINS